MRSKRRIMIDDKDEDISDPTRLVMSVCRHRYGLGW